MEIMTNSATGVVKTRILILSDTHGIEFEREQRYPHQVDVAIHCGDLTDESKLEELRATLRLLTDIQAPLKLIIAGNHDFTLDIPAFREKVAQARPSLDADLVRKVYGDYGEARQLLEDARSAGITFLDEGSHQYTLENGATLSVYASPYTPSLGDWGFQYHPSHGHNFEIPKGVDLAITHGPPKGIMDYTDNKQRAGCPVLFAAIARAQPRLHCFGHIHEGWGAKMVSWREQLTESPSYFTDIDNDKSTIIEKLSGFKHGKFDTPETKQEKTTKELYHRQQRCYATTHCIGDANPLEYGAQTLFINAAIQGTEEGPLQLPWLVDLELPKV
ncbi:MAG: helicase [Candelina mexicana]|nr:MAG: helicase [Candelina mexicana]